jgi:hypothetical protein
MRATVAGVALLFGLLLAVPAQAGGFGVYDQTGLHFGPSLGESSGAGSWLDQGAGVEVFLGRRDSRFSGRIRLSYAAIIDVGPAPDGGGGTEVLHAGLVSGGVQVELLKQLEKPAGLYLLADLGVSPLVTHMRAFMFADLGIGVRVRPTSVLELFAEVTGMFRYGKTPAGGPLVYLGARFSLD